MLMSEGQKHRLLSNRVALVRNLDQIPSVMHYLRQDNSLTEEMQQEIMRQVSRSSQVGQLLDILSRRSTKAFARFVYALVYTHQDELAKLLDPKSTERFLTERNQRDASSPSASYPPSHSRLVSLPQPLMYQQCSLPSHMPNAAQPLMQAVLAANGTIQFVPMYAGFSAVQQLVGFPQFSSAPATPISVPLSVNPVQESAGLGRTLTDARESQKEMVDKFLQEIERPGTAVMGFTVQIATSINPTEIIYEMSQRVRGRALIINNTYFVARQLEMREGAQYDVDNLEKLFTQLHFTVEVQSDKTAQEILEILNVERRRTDHSVANAFVLCLLTHGNQGHIYGTDGEKLEIDSITALFDGKNCRALRGKPKLFFIQACQGKKRSSTYATDGRRNIQPSDAREATPPPSGSRSSHQETSATSVDARLPSLSGHEMAVVEQKLNEMSMEDQPGYAPSLPSVTDDEHEMADMLISYATVKGYEAWRHSELGSWFVRSLVYVFSRQAHSADLLGMLTNANFLMSHLTTQGTGIHAYRQISEKRDTLRKKLFFLPGYFGS